MTGTEALKLLKDGIKVKRVNWRSDEYLATYAGTNEIHPSPKYNQYRAHDLHHLEDTVLLTDEILNDFLANDWEIVE
jgi:hypothetical protein